MTSLSMDPFDQLLPVTIPIKGDHPTLGLKTMLCPYRNRLRLTDMVLSMPASRIPKWRSILRNAYIIRIQGYPIHNEETLIQTIQQAHKDSFINLNCVFAIDKSYGIHPQEGIPQLYFDQLNVIAQHLKQIAKSSPTVRQAVDPGDNPAETPAEISPTNPEGSPPDPEPPPDHSDRVNFFKLKQLKQREDWEQWRQSRCKMLDQYQDQGMFSQPMALPTGANALHMLWTYFLKICGTRKSHMVCNGNPQQKGTATLGRTYENARKAC